MTDSFPVSLLGTYRPDWVIGRGRATVVWAVTRLADGAALALKRLPLTVMAQAWPAHPNLVRIHAQPRWDLLLMDRLRGHALRDHLAPDRHLPPAEAFGLLGPVLEATAALHAAGLAHGGLHGGNVILHEGLMPVLLEPETGRVPVLGAAPEILCGAAPHPGGDVWALGVLACQLLTGHAPHAGAPEAMRETILEGPPPRFRKLNPALPHAVAHWLSQAMTRNAAHRFADAGAMLDAVAALAPDGLADAARRG